MTDLMIEPLQKRTISDFFENVKDPRIERTKRHKLIDIIKKCNLCGYLWSRNLDSNRNVWARKKGMVRKVFGVTEWYSFSRYYCESVCKN
jgi:hypothetical protein